MSDHPGRQSDWDPANPERLLRYLAVGAAALGVVIVLAAGMWYAFSLISEVEAVGDRTAAIERELFLHSEKLGSIESAIRQEISDEEMELRQEIVVRLRGVRFELIGLHSTVMSSSRADDNASMALLAKIKNVETEVARVACVASEGTFDPTSLFCSGMRSMNGRAVDGLQAEVGEGTLWGTLWPVLFGGVGVWGLQGLITYLVDRRRRSSSSRGDAKHEKNEEPGSMTEEASSPETKKEPN